MKSGLRTVWIGVACLGCSAATGQYIDSSATGQLFSLANPTDSGDSAPVIDAGGLAVYPHDGYLDYAVALFSFRDNAWGPQRTSVVFPADDPTTGGRVYVEHVTLLALPDPAMPTEMALRFSPDDAILAADFELRLGVTEADDSGFIVGDEVWLREGRAVPDQTSLPGYVWADVSHFNSSAAGRGDRVALFTGVRSESSSIYASTPSLWAGTPDALEPVAVNGITTAVGTSGQPVELGSVRGDYRTQAAINANGDVVFAGSYPQLTGQPNFFVLPETLFEWSPDRGLSVLLESGDTIGDGYQLQAIGTPTLNAAGRIAFSSAAFSPEVPSAEALWVVDPGMPAKNIALAGNVAPGAINGQVFDLMGHADRFGNPTRQTPVLDEQGRVSFIGELRNADGSYSGGGGIWRGDGDALEAVALNISATGVSGAGRFYGFEQLAASPDGLLAFTGRTQTYDGFVNNSAGLYVVGHNDQIVEVIAFEDNGLGEIILADPSSGTDGRPTAINDWGQVVFKYRRNANNGSPYFTSVYTPDLYYRPDTSGSWDAPGAWTLGLTPQIVHHAYIAPDTDLEVTGPTQDAWMGEVTVGGGSGRATLRLIDGVHLTSAIYLQQEGVLTGSTDSAQPHPDGNPSQTGLWVHNDAGRIESQAGDRLEFFYLRNQSEGTLSFSLGQFSADAATPIHVRARIDLAGTLDVDFLGGFAPEAGEVFELLSTENPTNAIRGYFDHLEIAEFPGLAWKLIMTDNRLALAFLEPPIVGDYDGDGFVSQVDLDLVLLNWGDEVLPPGMIGAGFADGTTFDGLVSQNELDAVLLNWGDGTPPSVNAIPEPGTLGVLGLGVGLAAARRRRVR